jgi:hypothetical protein
MEGIEFIVSSIQNVVQNVSGLNREYAMEFWTSAIDPQSAYSYSFKCISFYKNSIKITLVEFG